MNLDNYKLATPDYFFDKEVDTHSCSKCGGDVEENRKDAKLCYDCEQNYLNNIEP